MNFTLSPEAASRFGQWTGIHVGDSLGIVLDGVVRSVPMILHKITDKGVITGEFGRREAEALAFALESGALPVPIRVLSEERIR